jgi:hypothetical protein
MRSGPFTSPMLMVGSFRSDDGAGWLALPRRAGRNGRIRESALIGYSLSCEASVTRRSSSWLGMRYSPPALK